jgi:hypothetical protein
VSTTKPNLLMLFREQSRFTVRTIRNPQIHYVRRMRCCGVLKHVEYIITTPSKGLNFIRRLFVEKREHFCQRGQCNLFSLGTYFLSPKQQGSSKCCGFLTSEVPVLILRTYKKWRRTEGLLPWRLRQNIPLKYCPLHRDVTSQITIIIISFSDIVVRSELLSFYTFLDLSAFFIFLPSFVW